MILKHFFCSWKQVFPQEFVLVLDRKCNTTILKLFFYQYEANPRSKLLMNQKLMITPTWPISRYEFASEPMNRVRLFLYSMIVVALTISLICRGEMMKKFFLAFLKAFKCYQEPHSNVVLLTNAHSFLKSKTSHKTCLTLRHDIPRTCIFLGQSTNFQNYIIFFDFLDVLHLDRL